MEIKNKLKMKISKINKPFVKISEENLNIYFSNLDEPNNIINGYAWFQYLTDIDYKKYITKPYSDKVRAELKEQIIQILELK